MPSIIHKSCSENRAENLNSLKYEESYKLLQRYLFTN